MENKYKKINPYDLSKMGKHFESLRKGVFSKPIFYYEIRPGEFRIKKRKGFSLERKINFKSQK